MSNRHHGNGANTERTKHRRSRYHENIKRRAKSGEAKAERILDGLDATGHPHRNKAGKGSYYIAPPKRKHWTQYRSQ